MPVETRVHARRDPGSSRVHRRGSVAGTRPTTSPESADLNPGFDPREPGFRPARTRDSTRANPGLDPREPGIRPARTRDSTQRAIQSLAVVTESRISGIGVTPSPGPLGTSM